MLLARQMHVHFDHQLSRSYIGCVSGVFVCTSHLQLFMSARIVVCQMSKSVCVRARACADLCVNITVYELCTYYTPCIPFLNFFSFDAHTDRYFFPLIPPFSRVYSGLSEGQTYV